MVIIIIEVSKIGLMISESLSPEPIRAISSQKAYDEDILVVAKQIVQHP